MSDGDAPPSGGGPLLAQVLSANCFRATRNADVVRNEEEAEDLLDMMTDEVRER